MMRKEDTFRSEPKELDIKQFCLCGECQSRPHNGRLTKNRKLTLAIIVDSCLSIVQAEL